MLAVMRAILLLLLCSLAAPPGAAGQWEVLEPGLELATFAAPRQSEAGDSLIRVLRIEPSRFRLRLLNASATPERQPYTPREWAQRHGLVAVINASMYQADYRTSVSLMKTAEHTNQGRVSKDNAVLAFDALDGDVPPVQIIDRTCQNFEELRQRYATLVQSIRMISCQGKNVWTPQPHRWSTAAIGVDRRGRVLFIHVRSPYGTHELIEMLLALPIALKNAMYVEGGAQAQLYARGGSTELELAGIYESGFVGEALLQSWPLPNVIGVARIERNGDRVNSAQ